MANHRRKHPRRLHTYGQRMIAEERIGQRQAAKAVVADALGVPCCANCGGELDADGNCASCADPVLGFRLGEEG